MKRVTRNGMIVAASGAMAVAAPASAAFAAPGVLADGAAVGSPGLISGDTVQFPVHAPVDVCGNTVNVVGLLNSAAVNGCADESGGSARGLGGGYKRGGTGAHGGAPARGVGSTHSVGRTHSGAGVHRGAGTRGGGSRSGGASTSGGGFDSSGLLSGLGVQVPVQAPVNLSGNSVNVVGVGNATAGNESVNIPGGGPAVPDRPDRPERPDRPVRPAHRPAPPKAHPGPRPAPPQHLSGALADTGADRTVPAALGSAVLVLGGAIVYRRYRPRAAR